MTSPKSKSAEVSRFPSSISLKLSKEILVKSKFNMKASNSKKLYVQVSRSNVEDIICIKDTFLKLPTKKVIEINDIVNNNKAGLVKPRINMTTKEPLRKQVIVIIHMSSNNFEVIGNFANIYITNINRCLKEALLDTVANFI